MSVSEIRRPSFKKIEGAMAWKGSDYANNNEWIVRLDDRHIAELKAAADGIQANGIAHRDISVDNFHLPTLHAVLSGLRPMLHDGRGFCLIKGIRVEEHSRELLKIIMLGMGAHLGVPVSQSYRGDYLGEVKNYAEPGNERPYRGGGAINMHRDPCDIVGLLCLVKAKRGGASRLTSSATIWNTFIEERPDLIDPLLDGFRLYVTKDDRHSESPVTPFRIPVFTLDPDELLHCTFIAELAESAVEKGGEQWAPKAQEAIAYFREIANRPGIYLDMQIEEGDIQLLNNRTTVHGRTDYEEWPELERKRMMYRLWLMCPDWPQPKTAVNRVLFGATDRADGGVQRR